MAILANQAIPAAISNATAATWYSQVVASVAVNPLVDVIKALVPALKLLNTEGLVECVLGFLLNLRSEVAFEKHISHERHF